MLYEDEFSVMGLLLLKDSHIIIHIIGITLHLTGVLTLEVSSSLLSYVIK